MNSQPTDPDAPPNPANEAEPQESLGAQKLRAEIRNLDANTLDLKRSTIARPTFWISVATALVAVFGVVAQAKWSKNEFILASIQKEQAELALQKLQRQQAVIKSELSTLDSMIQDRRLGKVNIEAEINKLEELRSALGAAVSGAETADRFSPIPRESSPNEHLHGLLDGWWKSADIRAIWRVETKEKNGWALIETR